MNIDFWLVFAMAAQLASYGCSLTACGIILFDRFVARDQPAFFLVSRWPVFLLIVGGVVSSVIATIATMAYLSGDVQKLNGEFADVVLTGPVRTAFYLRLLGSFVLSAAIFLRVQTELLMATGVAIIMASFAMTGHVWALGRPEVVLLLLVHLLGVSFWMGSLWPLKRAIDGRLTLSKTADIAERFGQIALYVVAALLIAGLLIAWILLGDVAHLIGSAYGQNLLFKIGLFCLLMALAAANKWRFVPGLRAANLRSARSLSLSITVECVLLPLILAASVVLTTLWILPHP